MDSYFRHLTYYLPEKVLTNDELGAEFPGWNIENLYYSTGVYQRHIAAENETTSDMAVCAAEKMFAISGFDREKIDLIIFCSHGADYVLPSTACIIQDRLKIKNMPGAIDVNQGCTGFVYGMAVADGLIKSGAVKNILLLAAEKNSRYLYHKDKSSRFIFGDAASACLVTHETAAGAFRIGDFVFGTDGKGFSKIIMKHGAERFPIEQATGMEYIDEYGNIRTDKMLFMDGSSVFHFSLTRVPKMINDLLLKSGNKLEDIDLFVFHQGSKIILETLKNKLQIPDEKMIIDIHDYGNTASASIPIVFVNALASGRIQKGFKMMLVSFGVGFSWASAIVTSE